MNFKPEIKEIGIIENVFSKNTSEIAQCDIIVPDVSEDIGKILTAEACAVVESKEISAGRLTISGIVKTDILYSPQSGGIDALHSEMTFSHTEKAEDGSDVSVRCHVNSVDCSLYNPRKMNLRVNLGLNISATRDVSKQFLASCQADSPTESLTQKINTVSKHVKSADAIPFRETMDIPSGNPSAAAVLKCTASLTDRDFKLLSNKAVIRGNLTVTVLYKGEDGTLSKAEFTKPITEITDAPGAEENMKENITVSLSPFSATPTASADGAMRAFFIEGKLHTKTDCRKEATETVITDMFCTGCKLKLTSSSITEEPECETSFLCGTRDIIPHNELNAAKILETHVNTIVESAEVKDGEISISGFGNTELLVQEENGSYACQNRRIPFSYHGTWDKGTPTVLSEAKGVSATLTGGGDAEVRFTAALSVFSDEKPEISYITNAEAETDKNCENRPSLVVCFAKPGDTLWSIAKKYGVTRKNIENANTIGDCLKEGQKIIIPR